MPQASSASTNAASAGSYQFSQGEQAIDPQGQPQPWHPPPPQFGGPPGAPPGGNGGWPPYQGNNLQAGQGLARQRQYDHTQLSAATEQISLLKMKLPFSGAKWIDCPHMSI
jgi:hypothetical protein